MGMARLMCRVPVILVIVVLVLCAGLSTWGLMAATTKAIKFLVNDAVAKYDVLFPEITIKGGQASIREKQPYYVDIFGGKRKNKDLVMVIDTREDKEKDAMDYLKDAQSGAVLTRSTVVFKNQHKTQIVPLKGIGDIVINSGTIKDLSTKYVPMLIEWAAVIILFYFLLAKPAQALLLAMIPYFAARSYGADTTYGQSLKIAILAMPVPVILDLVADLLHVHIPASFVLYFVLYIGVILLVTRDLVAAPPFARPAEQIRPS
jgi:hypothetical protein